MNLDTLFGNNSLLQQNLSEFTPRYEQQQMAEAIARTIELKAQLIVEAGTGIGKTFAYLVPIFLSEKKSIIATGTKHLQDQLFLKDIPVIKKMLSSKQKVVLLKGRANYLCHYRLKKNMEDGRFVSRQLVTELSLIREWAQYTQLGDKAELSDIAEDSNVWHFVTSTTDNCLNQECEFYNSCFVVKARKAAIDADIIVINHHLFFADMVLQTEGYGELLPEVKTIVFDEAHQLPEIASLFFSIYLTSRQLNELSDDIEAEVMLGAKEQSEIVEAAIQLKIAIKEMRTALGVELKKMSWPKQLPINLKNAIENIKTRMQTLDSLVKPITIRSKGLENVSKRIIQMIEKFNLLTSSTQTNQIHWYETHLNSFSIQMTPLIVADHFKEFMQTQSDRAWIFTSATLTVKENFNLFVETMGLEKALQLQLKSPFDYQKQSILYAPRGLPDPRESDYHQKLIETIIPIIELTQGRTFLLFTSFKALDYVAENIKEKIAYPLLIQGSSPKHELINQFKKLGNAVLLGTSSFWYGVDVRGDALSCVIIDKLPFTAPDDPVLQGRIDLLRKQGIDPFDHYQLPQAVLMLKQGAGRLIRNHTDRGVLVICDPRLVANRYGTVFLQSLPNMRRTRELKKVEDFLKLEKMQSTN